MPERNDQEVFQAEERVTTEEARAYLTRLFRQYTEDPVPERRLRAALAVLGSTATPGNAPPAADVPVGGGRCWLP